VRKLGPILVAVGILALVAPPANATHARPRGATPITASLVPWYGSCTAPNRTHGAPLAFPSCAPPNPPRDTRPGTPDANGAVANQVGRVRFDWTGGAPGPPDDADVYTSLSITDVRCFESNAGPCPSVNSSGGGDYDGEFQYSMINRITDHHNGPSGNETATMSDIPFPVNGQCVATADTSIGGTCAVATSFNAVVPGAISDAKRITWEMGPVVVYDGGSDKRIGGAADNFPFAEQGVFIP
jgi:hypothetical protein